jgi:putative tryptophan/tyrosine transport system substrate-binding protein
MKRRDYISLIGARWPLPARAQQRPIPRIGVIAQSPIWDHFRRGLNELGYLDGRDIVIEYRSAQGQPDRLAAVASELAGLSVDVIVTSGSAACGGGLITWAIQRRA